VRVRHTLLVLTAALALAIPATAFASSSQVIQDCAEDGHLDRHYSNSELQGAERNLPSDLNEYSDCRDVIRGAVVAGPSRGSGSGGDSSAQKQAQAGTAVRKKTARRRARRQLADASRGAAPDVSVGGRNVRPGENGVFDVAGAAHGMPLPLVLALIALGLLALAGSTLALRRRFPALANVVPRVPFGRFRR
jgi:hypothetical protein